jgi:hypothetical protein
MLTACVKLMKQPSITFCATEIDPSDANFYSALEIDWETFWLSDVPELYGACCRAMGINQQIFFTDDIPIQASWNSISPDDPHNPRMYVGVGNLEAYPFSTLIAVILHELGHVFCYRTANYNRLVSKSVKRQRELIADVVAGGAFAKMEKLGVTTQEQVRGQCSTLEVSDIRKEVNLTFNDKKTFLSARKLIDKRTNTATFSVQRADGRVEILENFSMIGETPEPEVERARCVTVHERSVDFVAMISAVSSWRTFGDLPDSEESHGSPRERFNAFAFGYHMVNAEHGTLEDCLTHGARFVAVEL